MKAIVTIEVGRLLCSQVRDYLGAKQLACPELKWHESSGWIERTFTISAPLEQANQIRLDLSRWLVRLQAAAIRSA